MNLAFVTGFMLLVLGSEGAFGAEPRKRLEDQPPDVIGYHAGWGISDALIDQMCKYRNVKHEVDFSGGLRTNQQLEQDYLQYCTQMLENNFPGKPEAFQHDFMAACPRGLVTEYWKSVKVALGKPKCRTGLGNFYGFSAGVGGARQYCQEHHERRRPSTQVIAGLANTACGIDVAHRLDQAAHDSPLGDRVSIANETFLSACRHEYATHFRKEFDFFCKGSSDDAVTGSGNHDKGVARPVGPASGGGAPGVNSGAGN